MSDNKIKIAPGQLPRLRVAGKKYDAYKAPIVQGCLNYFPRALEAVALVSKYGADKYSVAYSDQNWRRVDGAIDRYSDALLRHLSAVNFDGEYDPESAHLHLAHAAWNALAILEMTRNVLPALNPNPDLDKLAPHMRERYESKSD